MPGSIEGEIEYYHISLNEDEFTKGYHIKIV